MKNKLLVCVCSLALVAFGLTSCEPERGNVTDVCTDMLKETMHKSARSLEQLDGQTLKISEFEFLGDVNDNRLVYRTISFGNGTGEAKKVDSLTYEYGEWLDQGTAFTLLVTPREGDPFTLIYKGNAFHTPDGLDIGGEGLNTTARVEKWEKTIATLPNTEWEATFRGDFVLDSAFRDSTTFVPFPRPGHYETFPVFDHMDTVTADTTCYFKLSFERDPNTLVNNGHFYSKAVRTKYDRETKTSELISQNIKDYDCNWFFSTVTSGAKFMITMKGATSTDVLNISSYKLDEANVPLEFTLGGLTFKPVPAP